MGKTLSEKVWDAHVVRSAEGEPDLLYIDLHLVHEVTSPQAFEGLRMSGRKVHAPEKTLAVVDHNVPTSDRSHGIEDPESRTQVETLAENVISATEAGDSRRRPSSWPSPSSSRPIRASPRAEMLQMLDYSCRRASIGDMRAALRAG